MNDTDNDSSSPSPRARRLRVASVALIALGATLFLVRWRIDADTTQDPCARVRICDAALFQKTCNEAASYPEVKSLLAVLGDPQEERCPEGESWCEVQVLGGPGPFEDACVVRYEKESGRILEARWHTLKK